MKPKEETVTGRTRESMRTESLSRPMPVTMPPPQRRSVTGQSAMTTSPAPRQGGGGGSSTRFFPNQPRSLSESGLSPSMVEELVLKALFFAGELRGADLVQRIKLPQSLIDEIIEGLRRQKYVDLKGGAGVGVGKSSMIYTLTTYATDLLRQIFERNRYNGPAPVPFADWLEVVALQTVKGMRVTKERMRERFGSSLVVDERVFDGLGPALNSGKSIFFHGPPGNGKTALCQALARCYDGDIWVPHALLIDDFIVRLYDENVHQARADDADAPAHDARWVRCRRPLVIVGGELSMESLDLIYSPEVKYYEAPFQLKATNGMLLIDDFGRQRVSPKDLLNRWIVPLENEVDFLTFHTGKKLQVPFDVFVAFSTNLNPADLVDEAFLRRVRYKLAVAPPDEQHFHDIWAKVCQSKRVPYDGEVIEWLIDTHYRPHRRNFAACHPRDLLSQVIDIAHYRGVSPSLNRELLGAAAQNYFVHFTSGT